MSRGLNVLSKLKNKTLSSLKLQQKGKNINAKSLLKSVPPDIKRPPYAFTGIVPPSPSYAEIKTESEIKHMKEACQVARKVLNIAKDFVKVFSIAIYVKFNHILPSIILHIVISYFVMCINWNVGLAKKC